MSMNRHYDLCREIQTVVATINSANSGTLAEIERAAGPALALTPVASHRHPTTGELTTPDELHHLQVMACQFDRFDIRDGDIVANTAAALRRLAGRLESMARAVEALPPRCVSFVPLAYLLKDVDTGEELESNIHAAPINESRDSIAKETGRRLMVVAEPLHDHLELQPLWNVAINHGVHDPASN